MSCLRSGIVDAVTSTLCGMALAAAEVAANGTDIYVYLLSWQTADCHSFNQTPIHIRSTFDGIIRQDTNTLFGPLFGPNRIFGTVQL